MKDDFRKQEDESNEHGFPREQYPYYLMLEKELGKLLDKEALRD